MRWAHIKTILKPARSSTHKRTHTGIIMLLALSAISILIAPLIMPAGYSWSTNFISESAAQNLDGAWVARMGFLFFGFAVLWLTISLRFYWAIGTYWFHMVFGLLMVSTAAFSHRPWLTTIPFDPIEDFLHSLTANAMGIAFALGVTIRLLQRKKNDYSQRRVDALAIAAAIILPIHGMFWPSAAGVSQRLMFIVAYLWYGNESLWLHLLTKKSPNQLTARQDDAE